MRYQPYDTSCYWKLYCVNESLGHNKENCTSNKTVFFTEAVLSGNRNKMIESNKTAAEKELNYNLGEMNYLQRLRLAYYWGFLWPILFNSRYIIGTRLKAFRHQLASLNRIAADKSRGVIVASVKGLEKKR